MRTKGVDALQLVFAMFILIVVTLVVIRLFSTYVTKDTLPPLDDFRQSYDYERQKSKCNGLCSDFTERGNCEDLSFAVQFCQQKVKVDIDGNYKTGEARHFGLIAGIPYCEDGLYCFHLTQDCSCGSMVLNAESCLRVMQDYYIGLKLPEETANDLILKRISYGSCEADPFKWPSRKLTDGTVYEPQKLPDGSTLGADYWFKSGGYDKLKTGTTTTTTTSAGPGVSFSCSKSGTKITCSWSGCSDNTDVIVALTPGAVTHMYSNKPSGTDSFENLEAKKYRVVLQCGDVTQTTAEITIS